MLYLIRLRTALLCDRLYYILLIIVLVISLINISFPKNSKYKKTEKEIIGKITDIYLDGNYLKLEVYGKEKIICNYYFKSKKEITTFKNNYLLGDIVYLKGNLKSLENSKTKNIFDYKKYQNNKRIYYLLEIKDYKKLSNNKNIYYKIKQLIIKRIGNNHYLNIFLLGNKKYLSNDVVTSFQNNGLSHLFAISGMHVNLLGTIILKLLKLFKIKENKTYLYASIFLLFYASITSFSSSVLRGVLFFILFSINKIFYLYIKNTNIFITTLAISLLYEPYFLYDIGFWYSFSISLSLLVTSDVINRYKNYFSKLLVTSIISFIMSIPISLYNFYQFNLLSIVYNLFYVPFVSIILFPLSLATFIIKPLEKIYNFFITILETTSLFFNKITIATFIFPKTYKLVYIIYFILVIITFIGLKLKRPKYILPLVLVLIIHYLYPYIDNSNYIKMIDVGQGDSFLIHSNNKNLLIDTGGIMSYKQKSWQVKTNQSSIVKNTTIPLLKSLGVKKIDYLLLTHGDYDHLGEAINLINNFKVEKIYLNEGTINYLEKNIIKNHNNINISYEGTNIKLGNFTLAQINTDLKEENDSSSIYYVTYKNMKMLFMGDATTKSEEYILDNYQISNIDILKVGHHGSLTSSSEKFIKKTNPKIALISAGKNNKFNHPREEILNRLNKYNIKYYLTINDGTTTIDLENYKIITDSKKNKTDK